MNKVNKIILVTLPRSGTVFTKGFIAQLFSFNVQKVLFTSGVYLQPPLWDPYPADTTFRQLDDRSILTAHYALTPELRRWLDEPGNLGVYLYRDPRDVAVSAALAIKHAMPGHIFHPHLQGMSDDEAISFLLTGGMVPSPLAEHKNDLIHFSGMRHYCDISTPWMMHQRIVKLRYEDWTQDIYGSYMRAFNRQGITLDEKRLRTTMADNDFSKYSSGRKQGTEDKKSHFRIGVPGNFRQKFKPLHVSQCKHSIGQDLINLGYEYDLSW